MRHRFRHQLLHQVNRCHVRHIWRYRRDWTRPLLRHGRRFDSILVREEKDFRSRLGRQRSRIWYGGFRAAFHVAAVRVRMEGHAADFCGTVREHVRLWDADEESGMDNRRRVSRKICTLKNQFALLDLF